MEARVHRLIWTLCVVALTAGTAAGAARPVTGTGRLSGVTQISFGCPGPAREGEPCEHWLPLAHARFTLAKIRADGTPAAVTARLVESDADGRFTLLLPAGRYRLKPLPQAHTTGGADVTVAVYTGRTTRALVRFHG